MCMVSSHLSLIAVNPVTSVMFNLVVCLSYLNYIRYVHAYVYRVVASQCVCDWLKLMCCLTVQSLVLYPNQHPAAIK